MMTIDRLKYKEAKKIYFSFDGLFFHMDREGFYEEYKKYGIPKELESIWNREILLKYVVELKPDKDKDNVLASLSGLERIETIPYLIGNLTKSKNAWYILRYCETIWQIIRSNLFFDTYNKNKQIPHIVFSDPLNTIVENLTFIHDNREIKRTKKWNKDQNDFNNRVTHALDCIRKDINELSDYTEFKNIILKIEKSLAFPTLKKFR